MMTNNGIQGKLKSLFRKARRQGCDRITDDEISEIFEYFFRTMPDFNVARYEKEVKDAVGVLYPIVEILILKWILSIPNQNQKRVSRRWYNKSWEVIPMDKDKMDETLRWFTTADLSQYEDKYIAIIGKKVVCADDDPEVVYTQAKKKFPNKEIVLWKVPYGEIFIF